MVLSATTTIAGGKHFSSTRERDLLDPYIRVDLNASFQAHENFEIFGRVENLFDVEHQVRDGFNTPRLSAYAGVRDAF